MTHPLLLPVDARTKGSWAPAAALGTWIRGVALLAGAGERQVEARAEDAVVQVSG